MAATFADPEFAEIIHSSGPGEVSPQSPEEIAALVKYPYAPEDVLEQVRLSIWKRRRWP